MKLLILSVLVATFIATVTAGNVVCYFHTWAIYRPANGTFSANNVDPTLCTHINYAFVGLNENATINVLDDWEMTGLSELDNLMSLKENNPDLKIMLSMGGWNEGSATYSNVSADPDLRAALVENVVAFLDEHGFDGFDLYWQYPGQRDGDPENDPVNFVTLLGELKKAFSESGYILSAAVTGNVALVDISYPNGTAVSENVDMLNILTYDYHGTWENMTGQGAPLYASSLETEYYEQILNVAAGIQYWIDIGAEPAKINMGIAAYGHTYILENDTVTGLFSPAIGPGEAGPYTAAEGSLGYNEICELYGDIEPIWDDEQKVPYLVIEDLWIGYDNVESVQLKVEFANELGLGGVMFDSLDEDDFLGICGDPYPLLTTINENLNQTIESSTATSSTATSSTAAGSTATSSTATSSTATSSTL